MASRASRFAAGTTGLFAILSETISGVHHGQGREIDPLSGERMGSHLAPGFAFAMIMLIAILALAILVQGWCLMLVPQEPNGPGNISQVQKWRR